MHEYTIGVDESGTGAWAGPFVVCACALLEPVPGLRDSKKLTEAKRIELTGRLLDPTTAILVIKTVSVQDIRKFGHQNAWESAVQEVAVRACSALTATTASRSFQLVVDGTGSGRLWKRLPHAKFEAKADDLYPSVSAASIVAKTQRNSVMRILHKEYPQYGWDENFGYGVKVHADALLQYGPSPHHRKIRGRT